MKYRQNEVSSIALIAEAFKISETIKPTGEPYVPLRKLRKYIEMFRIKEETFKNYLFQRNSYQNHYYVDILAQKLYHPTAEDLETDEAFMNNIRVL
jgi:hypothetical protein